MCSLSFACSLTTQGNCQVHLYEGCQLLFIAFDASEPKADYPDEHDDPDDSDDFDDHDDHQVHVCRLAMTTLHCI